MTPVCGATVSCQPLCYCSVNTVDSLCSLQSFYVPSSRTLNEGILNLTSRGDSGFGSS